MAVGYPNDHVLMYMLDNFNDVNLHRINVLQDEIVLGKLTTPIGDLWRVDIRAGSQTHRRCRYQNCNDRVYMDKKQLVINRTKLTISRRDTSPFTARSTHKRYHVTTASC